MRLTLILLFDALFAAHGWNNAKLKPTWSNRLGVTLTPISTGVWAAERPLKRWGLVDVGTRTVIARTSTGGLAVHSPGVLDACLKDGIDSLGGAVECIIGRKDAAWKDAFPAAAYLTMEEAITAESDTARCKYSTDGAVASAFEGAVVEGDAELMRKYGLGISERVEGRVLSSLLVRPWMSPERLTLFFHPASKTLLCGQAWWNWPTAPRPRFEGESGAEGTGLVHQCSKVPIEGEDALPSVPPSRRTKAWAALKNRVFWPVRRSLLSQGGLNLGGWVLWTGGRPPGRAQRIYREQIEAVLAWEPEVLVPAHGDIVRGKEACRQLLEAHFLPEGFRSGSRDAPDITLSPYAEGIIPLKNYFKIQMPMAFQRMPKVDPRKPPTSDDADGDSP